MKKDDLELSLVRAKLIKTDKNMGANTKMN